MYTITCGQPESFCLSEKYLRSLEAPLVQNSTWRGKSNASLYLSSLVAAHSNATGWFGFVVRGESPGCRLISTASMLEWLRNLLPHHSQGSSTERWSRNTLRVVTARVFYVLRGFLTSPFILNNSVETAAPFNVVSHPRCSEPRN